MLPSCFHYCCFLIASLALAPDTIAGHSEWNVTSPNGKVSATVQLDNLSGQRDYPSVVKLYYRLSLSGETVIHDSPLGLVFSDADFTQDLEAVTASASKFIEERYTTPHGKRRERFNRAHEMTLVLRGQHGRVLEMDFRAYDDGLAFRYRLPGSPQASTAMLTAEDTGFALPTDGFIWAHPADNVTVYSPAYETYFENEIAVGTPCPMTNGWSFPLLFRTADAKAWGLITEAGLGTNFCGMRLHGTAAAGVYRMRFPEAAEGNGTGNVFPISSTPWEMPWRVIIVGDSPATIVESTLVEDVSPPSILQKTWIG